METIGMRMMQAIDALGINKSEFARKINVTPAYISKLSKRLESVPSDRTIADICREFGVSETWLRTGEGEMFSDVSRDKKIAAFLGDVMAKDDDDFRRQLIDVLADLSLDDWKVLEKIARQLVAQQDAKQKQAPPHTD